MANLLKKILKWTFGAFLFLCFSCSDISDGESADSSIVVSLPGKSDRSIFAKEDAQRFVISLSPETHSPLEIEASTAVQSAKFTGVKAGRYTVTVKAFDSDGTKSAQGKSEEFSVRVGAETQVRVSLRCCVKDIETWEELVRAEGEAEDGDTLVLKGDLAANSTLSVSKNLSIKSERGVSRNVFRSEGFSGEIFRVESGKTLSLGGNAESGGEVIVEGNENAKNPLLLVLGTLNLLENSVLENNESSTSGGAVYVSSGGVLSMSGGEISGNSAVSGGAVFAEPNSTVRITGGTITGNSASASGDGIYAGGKIYISGSPTIDGNHATDEEDASNLYIAVSCTQATLNSRELKKNITVAHGIKNGEYDSDVFEENYFLKVTALWNFQNPPEGIGTSNMEVSGLNIAASEGEAATLSCTGKVRYQDGTHILFLHSASDSEGNSRGYFTLNIQAPVSLKALFAPGGENDGKYRFISIYGPSGQHPDYSVTRYSDRYIRRFDVELDEAGTWKIEANGMRFYCLAGEDSKDTEGKFEELQRMYMGSESDVSVLVPSEKYEEDMSFTEFRGIADNTERTTVTLRGNVVITGNTFTLDRSGSSQLVVDGQGKYHIEGNNSTFIFKNVKFQNCYNKGFGGALDLSDCSSEFENCVFEGNQASYRGGAINLAAWSAGEVLETRITNCTFTNNLDNEGCYDINASGQYTHLSLGGGNSSTNSNPVICQSEVANGHADGSWE